MEPPEEPFLTSISPCLETFMGRVAVFLTSALLGEACFAGFKSVESSLWRHGWEGAAADSSSSGVGFGRLGASKTWSGERSTSM
jgi:hypothetical protein